MRIAILLAFNLIIHFLSGQSEVRFVATMDMNQVRVGEYFDIAFTLSNGKGQQFQPPNFKEFEVVSGPNRSVFTSISNGRMSSEMKYSYGLIPTKKGAHVIGAASMKVGRKTIKTNVLKVEVVEKSSNVHSGEMDSEEPYFIQTELSNDSVLVGQQVRLDYKLYTRVDIDNYNMQRSPDLKDFYTRHFRQRGQVRREQIGNQSYTTKILKSISLFPQKAGVFDIAPAVFQISIPVDDGSGRNFLLIRPTKAKIVSTDEITLHVGPLPKNAPPDFNGAVGQYKVDASINGRQVSTDGAIALKLQIHGNGDAKRLMAPTLDFGEQFEIYEPQLLKEEDFQSGGFFQNDKIFEYQIVPLKPGHYEFSPHFTYFDPDSSSFITVFADTFNIEVKKGAGTYVRSNKRQNQDVVDKKDIRFIHQKTKLKRAGTTFFGSWQYWSLVGLPMCAFLGLLGFKNNWWSSDEGKSLAQSRMEKAQKMAIARMKQAEIFMHEKNVRGFYDETSKALLGYASDKIQIPASELSKANIQEKLHAIGVEAHITRDFVAMLETCEFALFGGQNPKNMLSDYNLTKRIIIDVEKAL